MDNQVERECPACGRGYYADATRLKFGRQTSCSRVCSYRMRGTNSQNRQEYECGRCGKRFFRSPSGLKARHGLQFCSRECAYALRKRVVTKPYVRTAVVDYQRASKKAWEARRRNAKPYPDAARKKAAARMVERIQKGGGVSGFERKAAEVFRRLGVGIRTSVAIRRGNGTYAHVFDIVLPARRLIVECHGTFWHGARWTWEAPRPSQAKNLAYEERKLTAARHAGLELRILWEHEFRKDPCGACLAVIR